MRKRILSEDKTMPLGSGWASAVNPEAVAKRFAVPVPPLPVWIPQTACVGDKTHATQLVKQAEPIVPEYPLYSVTDCSASMPHTCSIATVTLDPSVVTCGDCYSVPSGGTCYLHCADGRLQIPQGRVTQLTCEAGGFSSIPFGREPICAPIIKTCPDVYTSHNLVTLFGSNCVGAALGNVCRFACNPGFYSPTNVFESVCSVQPDGSLNWSVPVTCACQTCQSGDDYTCAAQPSNQLVNNFSFI